MAVPVTRVDITSAGRAVGSPTFGSAELALNVSPETRSSPRTGLLPARRSTARTIRVVSSECSSGSRLGTSPLSDQAVYPKTSVNSIISVMEHAEDVKRALRTALRAVEAMEGVASRNESTALVNAAIQQLNFAVDKLAKEIAMRDKSGQN